MQTPIAILPFLMLVPLLSGLLLPLLAGNQPERVRSFALVMSLINFVISLGLLVGFDFTDSASFGLVTDIGWFSSLGLNFSFGIDSISLWLVLLTTFLMPIVILSSFSAVKERVREFYIWLLLLEAAMIGVFVSTNVIFFYVCFEFTLVPMYFLIGIYGSSQRLKAARIFFLYTFTGSMFTFAGLLYMASCNGSTGVWNFDFASLMNAHKYMSETQQLWVMFAMLAGFAVKVPIFPVHTWLPLAHTEAPTAGSVVLAGVLLKLGTYALLRLAIPMLPDAALIVAPYMGIVAIIGIVYAALICWVQKDIKKLVAYSSISHLGFCILGMFAINVQGISGSVMYMINHGLSTGALFLLIGMVYERYHTREMSQLSGLAKVMPIWASFMVFFAMASVGLPGLNGFVGEFLTLLGAFTTVLMGPVYAAVAGTGLIFGAIYILYMLGKVVWGPLKIPAGYQVTDLNKREITVLIPLAVACIWLGVYPAPMLNSLEAPAAAIVQRVGMSREQMPPAPIYHQALKHSDSTLNHSQGLKMQVAQLATENFKLSETSGRLSGVIRGGGAQ
ncbi:MAG: NADH-quinone oxidoreductase subunit M [Phycisphaeraceae bacterium]|nr:NADH-quinone oxidoreductase subunit M [Phycisphaeraceae bacterium]